VTENRWNIHL